MEEKTKKRQLLSLPAPPSSSNNATNNDDQNGSKDHEDDQTNQQQPTVKIDKETEDYFKSLPPGYRFCPTDVELIMHYLDKKIKKGKLPRHRIHEFNLCKYSPDHISEMYPVIGEKEWYFFTPRNRKYLNGTRPNRAAGTGYWKATGADRPIRNNGSTIGFRKALVFYEGKPPKGQKTNWIMHEYRVNALPRKKSCAKDMRLDDYVLCRIYKKNEKIFKNQPRINEDEEQNDHVYLNSSPTRDQNHVQEYHQMEDYSQHISHNEYPYISHTEDEIAKYNSNLNQSYELGQTPVCYVPIMPSMNPVTINRPMYSTTNNYFVRPEYFADIDMSFVDPELNLDNILNDNHSGSPSDSPPMMPPPPPDKKIDPIHMEWKRKN